MLDWGVELTLHPDLLRTSKALWPLAQFQPQPVWALGCLSLGVVRLAVLFINGLWRRSPHLRATCGVLSTFFWLQIILGLCRSDHASMAIAVYPWLLGLDIWNVYHAAADARTSDDRARAAAATV